MSIFTPEQQARLAHANGTAAAIDAEHGFGSGTIPTQPIDRRRALEGHRIRSGNTLSAETIAQAWAMLREGMIEGLIAATYGVSIQALRREMIAGRATLAVAYWDCRLEAMRLNTVAHAAMVADEFHEAG